MCALSVFVLSRGGVQVWPQRCLGHLVLVHILTIINMAVLRYMPSRMLFYVLFIIIGITIRCVFGHVRMFMILSFQFGRKAASVHLNFYEIIFLLVSSHCPTRLAIKYNAAPDHSVLRLSSYFLSYCAAKSATGCSVFCISVGVIVCSSESEQTD